MKGIVAVATRELEERRSLLAAAAAASVLPFLASALPWLSRYRDPGFRALFALILATTFGVAGSVLVGGSILARDLADKRLGFHFARPLPAWAIWGGKLAAGIGLVVCAELLVLLPVRLLDAGFSTQLGRLVADPLLLWALLLHPIPLFLAANAAGVALRSRSPWLAVDFVAIVALAALAVVPARRLVRSDLLPEPRLLGLAVAAFLTLLFLAASYAQVAAGRVDARRAHGAQSLVLWGTLFPVLLGVEVTSRFAVDPGIGRIHVGWAAPTGASGQWAVVQGSRAMGGKGQVSYLLDPAAGRSILLSPWVNGVQVSAAGRRALFATTTTLPFHDQAELKALDLGRKDPSADPETVPLPTLWAAHVLSPEGDRAAVVGGGLVQALELPGFRLLASVKLPAPAGWTYLPVFAGRDVVRLYPWRGVKAPRIEPAAEVPPILELDVAGKRLVATGRYAVAPPRDGLVVTPAPDLSRLVVRDVPATDSLSLVDGRTGALVATAKDPGVTKLASAHFLADGRVLLVERRDGERTLGVLSPDGVRLRTIPLGAAPEDRITVGYEIAPGLVPVGRWRGGSSGGEELVLVDAATGSVRPTGKRVWPASPANIWWRGDERVPAPGSPVTRLFLAAEGRLVDLDPGTLETTDVLAPRRPRA